jgi:CMP-N,N'-diacetyllegionaminic acid synthase
VTGQEVLCVIPARGGSKGLPRKNVLPILGKSLVEHAIHAAQLSGVIDVILVSTDDDEIASIAREAGAEVPFVRPPDISDDLATTEAVLTHALLAHEESTGEYFDIGVFLTPTNVFRDPAWIRQCVEILREQPEVESAFTAHPTSKNYWQGTPDGGWERLLPWMRYYSSRQVRQVIYREDTGAACASRAWLWRAGRRIGDVVEIVPTAHSATGIDIHTAFDLHVAEEGLRYLEDHPAAWDDDG